MLLAIDTSTRYAGLAMAKDGATVLSLGWHSRQSHTVELMPRVEWLLHQAGASVKDLQGIAIALGPGSFSALRVGLSVAKGLAVSLRVPLVGVSTLEVEAYPWRGLGFHLCPIMEVGRGQVAWAVFRVVRQQWRKVAEERAGTVEELCQGITARTLFCGEGASPLADALREKLGSKALTPGSYVPTTRLQALVELGSLRMSTYDEHKVSTLQPLYLRSPSITEPRAPHPKT